VSVSVLFSPPQASHRHIYRERRKRPFQFSIDESRERTFGFRGCGERDLEVVSLRRARRGRATARQGEDGDDRGEGGAKTRRHQPCDGPTDQRPLRKCADPSTISSYI